VKICAYVPTGALAVAATPATTGVIDEASNPTIRTRANLVLSCIDMVNLKSLVSPGQLTASRFRLLTVCVEVAGRRVARGESASIWVAGEVR
jgi:hypothetical protein